jgi:hypothetical protein
MNIIDIQDQLKNFSENQLIGEMQMPSGSAPQFLVLSEIQRRKRVRDDFSKREAANQQTVAQEAVAAAGVPMQGIAGMSEAMAPQSAASEGIGTIMPQSMRQAMPTQTEQPVPMAEGGVIHAQQGTYFGGMSEEDIDLNDILDAIQSYESDRSKNAFGSAPTDKAMSAIGGVGERSAYQIRPETLLDFGRGYESYQPIFPSITDRIGEGRDFSNAFEAYKDPEIKAQVDEYLSNPSNARDAAMGVLSSSYTETGDIDKAIMAYNAGLPGVLKGSEAGLPYLKGVKGRFDEMSDRRTFILGGIASAAGPMAIRGLGEQYYGQGDPEIDAALEARGYNPAGMAVVTTEPATATKDVTLPTGDVIKAGETIESGTIMSQSEAQSNAIPADATGSSVGKEVVVDSDKLAETSSSPSIVAQSETASVEQDDETDTDTDTDTSATSDEATTTKTPESNITYSGGEQAGASSLEAEIKKLQSQMEKSREQDKWLAIAQAGLSLMSSKEPTLLGAAGEAGVSGLKAFREAQDRYQEGVVDLINARAKITKDGTKKGITASSAVSRINKIEELLNPTDPASIPLDAATQQRLREEKRYLERNVLLYPDVTA